LGDPTHISRLIAFVYSTGGLPLELLRVVTLADFHCYLDSAPAREFYGILYYADEHLRVALFVEEELKVLLEDLAAAFEVKVEALL
jgi:hypothetical protein